MSVLFLGLFVGCNVVRDTMLVKKVFNKYEISYRSKVRFKKQRHWVRILRHLMMRHLIPKQLWIDAS